MGNQFSRRKIEWIENDNGCHICTSHAKDAEGYILYRANGRVNRLHRYLFEQKYGEIPKGYVVMHICDNPSCINLEHLKLGTQKENVEDCVNKKRKWIPFGERNPKSKLTQQQVINILKDKRRQIDIAKEYGITQAQVSAIKLKKTWKTIYI